MSLTATFSQSQSGQSLRGDNKRWVASFTFVLVLHVVATVFLLRGYQNLLSPSPSPVPPSLTMIELAPLPAPPAPPVAAPPPPSPEPQVQPDIQPQRIQPQVQPREEPTPVAKPPPKPAKPRRIVPRAVPQPQPQPAQPSVEPAPAQPQQQPAVSAPPKPSVDRAVPRFTDLIAAQLERYKRYPPMAQRRGEQGVALLRFSLDRAGNISDARVERSSGHPDLDAEVLALVRRAAPLPQIPADIAANTLDVEVPVSFALR